MNAELDVRARMNILEKLMLWQGEALSFAFCCANPEEAAATSPDTFSQKVVDAAHDVTNRVIGNRSRDADFTAADFRLVFEATCLRCLEICGRTTECA